MILWVDLRLKPCNVDNIIQDVRDLISWFENNKYVTAVKGIPVNESYFFNRRWADPDHTKGIIIDTNNKTIKWCNYECLSDVDYHVDMECQTIRHFLNYKPEINEVKIACRFCKHFFTGAPYIPIYNGESREGFMMFDIGICINEDSNGRRNAVLTPTLWLNDGPDILNHDIPINYCPMCGAKLEIN